ncbi:MAG: 6-hydroxynicotinate reductase, partial [Deltaproteobacteria bacterium]
CGLCVLDCPKKAIALKDKKAVIGDECVDCGACLKVCPVEAPVLEEQVKSGCVTCEACPITCHIPEGKLGACGRYRNEDGEVVRNIPLHFEEDVVDIVGPSPDPAIQRPLITAIGAGTTYPDYRPSPFIAREHVDEVDVVTSVSEVPLSYSGVKLKIDTDLSIGEERSPVLFEKREVGHLCTEEYGSKILSIGGVNQLTSEHGMATARCISELANRHRLNLRIEGGARLKVQVGQAPIINGELVENMRVGCGSATVGLFAPSFKEAADEVIVIDSHITSLFTEHTAGTYLGTRRSGVRLKFKKSTPGRYFGEHGNGWGGTPIEDPKDIIEAVDMAIAYAGMTILITETTGRKAAMYRVLKNGALEEIPLSPKAHELIEMIQNHCEPSRVSGLYVGGSGGSWRAGVSTYPIKLTRAVHEKRAVITVGGAPSFILPGGGINFLVDVEKVKAGVFSWIPTPATVAPIEVTMRLDDYKQIGGHLGSIRTLRELREHFNRVTQ